MSNTSHRTRTTTTIAVASALAVPATTALATDYVWVGLSGSAWTNAVNWLPPGVPGAGDTVTFPDSATTFVDLGADQTVDSITFSTLIGAYTLATGNETLTVGDLLAGDTDDSATHVIQSDIEPSGGGAVWTIEGSTTVRLVGSLTGAFSLGKLGDGTLELAGVSDTYAGDVTVGAGTLSVQDGNALSDTRQVEVLSGATMIVADDETVGALAGDGDVLLANRALVIAGSMDTTFGGALSGDADSRLQHDGTGRLTMIGTGSVGGLSASAGEVVVSGGDLIVAGQTAFASSASTLVVDGGTFSTGDVELNGHTPTIRVSDPARGTAFTVGTNDGDSSIDVISDADGGPGSVRKVGTGSLTLTGDSTYSGGTVVDAGTLMVMNTAGSATGSGGVIVGEGASLGGNGRADGSTVVNDTGVVAPGASAGTLTLGEVSFITGSDMVVELGGLTPGEEHDQLAVIGSAAIAGGDLRLQYIDGFTAGPGNSFVILTAGTLNGEFASVTFPDDLSWSMDYDADAGTVTARVCADIDGSGAVDFGDILAILGMWGDPGGPADLNASGFVDFGDILFVLSAWGPCP